MRKIGRTIAGLALEGYRRRFRTGPPYIPPHLHTPMPCRGTVILTGVGTCGFEGYGKVSPLVFFPPFVYSLYRAGIRTVFYGRDRSMPDAAEDVCIIHIYNEEHSFKDRFYTLALPLKADVTFNSAPIGRVLGRKETTNKTLKDAGVLVPDIVRRRSDYDGIIFSNTATGSHEDTYVVTDTDELDDERYNTRYIETRRHYRDSLYYVSVRLLTVGRELLHAYVRLRPDTEGSASVHNGDMPLEPDLIEHFQKILVENRKLELIDLAGRIGDALGLGFFAHDLVISSESEQIYLCESGFKFNDPSFTERLLPIAPYLPSHAIMFSPELGRRSAEALVRECQRNGQFL